MALSDVCASVIPARYPEPSGAQSAVLDGFLFARWPIVCARAPVFQKLARRRGGSEDMSKKIPPRADAFVRGLLPHKKFSIIVVG
jgi:hypothetical protein